MATVQYTGIVPACFVHFVAKPGDIFTVPDAYVTAYTRRPDVITSVGTPTYSVVHSTWN